MIAAPAVTIDGTFNARDVGGHQTADGRRMRTGVLYRSAALDTLGPVGRADLVALGVTRVLDLRSSLETERAGVFDPADTGIEFHHLASPFGPPMASVDGFETIRDIDDPMSWIYPKMLTDGMPMFRDGLQLVAMGGAERPAIVHCTSGKDRTGLFAFIVQRLCGVSVDDALADYDRSGDELGSVHSDMAARFPEMSVIGREKLERMAGTDPAWVLQAFDTIGGIEALPEWLVSIGVSSAEQQAIRSAFVD